MRPLFSALRAKKPILTSMITELTAAGAIDRIRNSIYDGADAVALHLEILGEEYQSLDSLKNIFGYACDLPIMTINYRTEARSTITDEIRAKQQLLAIDAGAAMCDIFGDIFGEAPLQLAIDPVVVAKQKELIRQIHDKGGEVLMSSHTWIPMSAEHVLEHALALANRGADMVKIAMTVHSDEDLLEAIRATSLVSKQLPVPLLHVCMGQHGKAHRVFAPVFGSCMILCVQEYAPNSHKDQPLLRAVHTIYDNLDWHMNRNQLVGTRAAAASLQDDCGKV
ncbi:hypothetical protein AGMMS49992_19010 [Clostridia bacterium]|nr:hypothetical protein AGMMS49992_19010 [Clostridia bacterium]